MPGPIYLDKSQIVIAEDQFNLLPLCTEKKPDAFATSHDYSDYVMSCLTPSYSDHLIFYDIPEGLKLYRGDSTYTSSPSLPEGPMGFYVELQGASYGGTVHEFVVQQPLKVVSLDRVSNLQILKARAIEDGQFGIVAAMEHNFDISRQPNYSQIQRQGDLYSDEEILIYLCTLGYDGFAFKTMTHQAAQIFLCSPSTSLSKGQYWPQNQFFLSS